MTTPAVPPIAGLDSPMCSAEQTLADSINARPHALSGEIRRRAACQGTQTAEARLDAADERDVIADARDLAARARDDVASAAERGGLAAGDRHAAAEDREQAARERLHALVDREILAGEIAVTANDPLTGARARAAGLADLDRELDRCRRNGDPLIAVYVDVVGLKAINDSKGHDAGDDLLKRAVRAIQEHLRPYDLVVRLGGDEFLCAMSSMSLPDARERFAIIAASLAAGPAAATIRVGFAEVTPGESAAQLISRADGELLGAGHAEHEMRTDGPARRRPHERRPARSGSVASLRRSVVEFAAGGGATARQCEDVALAVSEALSNAVLHAYPDPSRPGMVAVDAWMSARWLHVVVSDEGVGMLPRAVPSGVPGRGLALIIRMTQRLEIEETGQGMRLRMTFAIG